MADHSENEVRKQRIREAFSDSKVVVEKMPAREDMTPELCAGTEIRVAPYCRVSTMSEQQTESYELQRQYYDEYINKHPEWTLVRIYADEGISATSTKKRKDFNAMIDDCRAGKIDLIVTKSISRFARNVVDCIEIARELKALPKPVGIYFQTENINTLTQNGELLLTVLAAFAQDESVTKSLSVAWGIRQRFMKGIPKKTKVYGYKLVEDKLEKKEPEASVVQRIFADYLSGKSPCQIAKELTQEGIKTPKGKDVWNESSIRYILGNDKYSGDTIMQKTYCVDLFAHKRVRNYGQVDKYRARDTHEPLVSKEDWKKAKNLVMMPEREMVIHSEDDTKIKGYKLIEIKEDIDTHDSIKSV